MNDEDKPQLEALRVRPDGDEEFRRALHLRLAEVGDPKPYGLWDRWRDLLGEHTFAAGAFSGLALAAVAFLALRAVSPTEVQAPMVAEVSEAPAGVELAAPETATEEMPTPPVVTPPVVATVPAEMVAVVRFEFRSEVEVQDVTFNVSLPDGLHFYSEGELLEERAFEWVAELEEGETQIPVAVRGAEPGRYRVTATALVDGEEIINEVILHVEESA